MWFLEIFFLGGEMFFEVLFWFGGVVVFFFLVRYF